MKAPILRRLIVVSPLFFCGVLFAAAPAAAPGRESAAPKSDAAKPDQPPVIKKQVAVKYPREMLQTKMDGVVEVGFIIDVKGNVSDAWVLKSPDPLFSTAAITAVKQWKFTPGMKDGKPVATNMSVALTFHLTSTPAKK